MHLASLCFVVWSTWAYGSKFAIALADIPALPCTFTIDNTEFDLCPLLGSSKPLQISTGEDTPPTYTTNIYAVGLGRPLKRDGTLPAELQCPEGTLVCLTVVNTRPNHPSEPERILQVVPIAGGPNLRPSAKLGPKANADDPHGTLLIHWHGGSYSNHPQKALFKFHCDKSVDEPSWPTLIWSFNGTHAFRWNTKHACAVSLPASPDPPSDPEPGDAPPDDPEADLDDDRTMNPPRHKRSTFFFLSLVAIVVVIVAIIYLPRQFLLRLYRSVKARAPTQFRPTPARLLLWSQQAGMDEEVDLMVNSNPQDYGGDTEDDMSGEEIPLTPNPKGLFGKSKVGASPGIYGSFGVS